MATNKEIIRQSYLRIGRSALRSGYSLNEVIRTLKQHSQAFYYSGIELQAFKEVLNYFSGLHWLKAKVKETKSKSNLESKIRINRNYANNEIVIHNFFNGSCSVYDYFGNVKE